MHIQYRGTEGFDCFPAVAVNAADLGNKR